MKLKTIVSTLSFLMMAVSGCATENLRTTASMTLRDGSVIKGTLLTDEITGVALFDDDLELPAKIVKSVEFTSTNRDAKVTLVNGDHLKLKVKTDSFKLDSSLGKLTVMSDNFRSISLSTRKVSTNGVFDVDAKYYVIDISAGPTAESYPVTSLDEEPVGGWTDEYKSKKLVLRRIEPGSFRKFNSGRVIIEKPFYIGVFEVTKLQYANVLSCDQFEDPDTIQPRNAVSYMMIEGRGPSSFMKTLARKSGLTGLCLPTDDQWEYACRAGTDTRFNNGSNDESALCVLGRYQGNQNDGKSFAVNDCLTAVGVYAPNAWGLYDMHGNLWEWTSDRTIRGGFAGSSASECTSSSVRHQHESNSSCFFGFRVCVRLCE